MLSLLNQHYEGKKANTKLEDSDKKEQKLPELDLSSKVQELTSKLENSNKQIITLQNELKGAKINLEAELASAKASVQIKQKKVTKLTQKSLDKKK